MWCYSRLSLNILHYFTQGGDPCNAKKSEEYLHTLNIRGE